MFLLLTREYHTRKIKCDFIQRHWVSIAQHRMADCIIKCECGKIEIVKHRYREPDEQINTIELPTYTGEQTFNVELIGGLFDIESATASHVADIIFNSEIM